MSKPNMKEIIVQACKAALADESATRDIYRDTKQDFVIWIDSGLVKGEFCWVLDDHPDFLKIMPPFLRYGGIIDANSRWREGKYKCDLKGEQPAQRMLVTFKPRRVQEY